VPDDLVRYALHDRVAVLTLDDGKANALSPATIAALHATLDRAERDAAAVLLVGRPGRFSAGFDLNVMTGDLAGVRTLVMAGAELLLRLYLYSRPVVAACTGHALAAGALMLLAADLRVGARGQFRIGLNEVALQLTLPVFAMELARDRLATRLFTAAVTQARIFDPDEACEAGFLDLLAAPDELFDTALAHAQRLAALPDPAFARTKRRERGATVERIRATLTEDIASLTSPIGA
jgi:enoyl-CoA hydratase